MERKAIADLEEASTGRARIVPHWLPGSNTSFWYRRWLAVDKYRFMLLNCETGHHQQAFDHEALVSNFKFQTDLDLDAERLPLQWIHVEADGSCVRFQLQNRTWSFSDDEHLAECSSEYSPEDSCIDFDSSRPSPKSPTSAKVTLTNLTGGFIDYYWVDYNGNSDRRRGRVRPGESVPLTSMRYHRWRLAQSSSKVPVFLELKQPHGIYTIENSHDGLAVSWQKDPFEAAGSLRGNYSPETKQKPKYEAFLRQNNVWARSQDGTERQASYDGYDDDRYRLVYPAPDGQFAVAMQCRRGCQVPFQLKDSIPKDQLRPKIINSPSDGGHPRAGDLMDVDKPRLFNLATAEEVPVCDSLFRNPFSIENVGWSECGKTYRFIFNERGHRHLRLLEVSLEGRVRILVEDSSDTVIDYNQKLYYKLLPSTNDIIWASERDGWNHLYTFSLEDGTLKNQVTQGDWLVRSVEYVDAINKQIWFTAYGMISGQDPYYAQLACVNFDGSNCRLLTREDGTHAWLWSPDRRFLIDSWSRVDLLPRNAVIEVATGKTVTSFQRQELPSELRAKCHLPERFAAKGRDGSTDIYGIIIRPCDFDERKLYPIIEMIYAGPFQFSTPKRFGSHARFREVANLGFVVVVVDGMGTTWRSKAFLDKSYKNLKDAGLPDRILWIRAAAKTRPWMDVSRVGVQGSSNGGQNAAAAVLHHGDFYRAAYAESGTHDIRMGNVKWSEMYMGWPVDESYIDNSNLAHAGKLSGALMLVTGELDEVVDPATTMQFAHALITADKDFDLVCLPGVGHSCGSGWLDRKKAQFFKRHLGDAQ